MGGDCPQPGQIIDYHYLWKWQDQRGETEGRKKRPCCVVIVAVDRNGLHHLFIAPITSKEPSSDRMAVLIPETEARRVKLDTDIRLWVIVDEVNYDILEQSYTLEDRMSRGRFSPVFVENLARVIKKIHSERTLRIANRN